MSQIPRAQLTQSLDVPGLAVTPPVSSGVAQAEQIFRAVGLLGGTVANVGNLGRQVAAEREAEQAEIDANLRGQAALDVQNKLPEFEQGVANGEYDDLFTDLQEGETVNDRVIAHLNSRLGDNAPQVYRDEVLKYAPNMTRMVVQRQQGLIDQNRAASAATILQAVGTARTPEDINFIAQAHANATGEDVALSRQRVISDLARLAQDTGDDKRTELLGEVAGKGSAQYLVTQARVQQDMRARQNQAEIDAGKQATEIVSASINEGDLDTALADLDKFRKSNPNLRESTYGALKQDIVSSIEKRNTTALLTAADALDRTDGITPGQYRDRLARQATDLGIPADRAYALNNRRLIEKARTLANDGDVDGVAGLEGYLTRASSDETQLFSDAVSQAGRRRAQIEQERADIMFREKAKAADESYVAAARDAYNNGIILDAALPTVDQVVEIDGREHTISASKLRRRAHEWVLGAEDTNLLLEIGKVAPDALRDGQTLYDAAANEVGGPGRLEAMILSNRARLVDRTGIADPQIEQLFKTSRINRIPVGVSPEELGPEVAMMGDLFDQLDRLGIAKMHMSAELYNRMSVARVNLASGRAPDFNTALVMAAHPPSVTDEPYTINDEDFEYAIADAIDGIDKNVGTARKTILDTANAAIRAGADRTAALEYATNIFQRDNIIINGSPVYHNGVGVPSGTIVPLFDGLRDYISETMPDRVKNLPTGDTSNLTMWRDPRSGFTRIMDASSHGGPLLDLTDEQLKVIAQDYGASAADTALFTQDIRKQNRNQRWADGDLLISEMPGEFFYGLMKALDVEAYATNTPSPIPVLPGAGQEVDISPSTPPVDSKDPVVKSITRYLRKRETLNASDRTRPGVKQQQAPDFQKQTQTNIQRQPQAR